MKPDYSDTNIGYLHNASVFWNLLLYSALRNNGWSIIPCIFC